MRNMARNWKYCLNIGHSLRYFTWLQSNRGNAMMKRITQDEEYTVNPTLLRVVKHRSWIIFLRSVLKIYLSKRSHVTLTLKFDKLLTSRQHDDKSGTGGRVREQHLVLIIIFMSISMALVEKNLNFQKLTSYMLQFSSGFQSSLDIYCHS